MTKTQVMLHLEDRALESMRLRIDPPYRVTTEERHSPPPPPPRTQVLEANDRMHPAAAGFVAGIFAGGAFAAAAQALNPMFAQPTSIGVACGAGAIVGAIFAMVTRNLRSFFLLAFWSLIFFPAMATAAVALVLPRIPGAPALPFLPVIAGSAAFAVVSALQVPLRVRRLRQDWERGISEA
jgi:hypothetical protein